MMPTHKYDFSDRSRKDMVARIMSETRGWYPHFDHGYPVAYNIRLRDWRWSQGKDGEYPVTPDLDDAWDKYIESHLEFSDLVAEDALFHYLEGEYSSYPGDDEGDWRFAQVGRRGGWLVLTKWRDRDFARMSREDFETWLEELPFADLRKFYVGIMCLDKDLADPDTEMAYHANYRRHEWEQKQVVDPQGMTPFASHSIGV